MYFLIDYLSKLVSKSVEIFHTFLNPQLPPLFKNGMGLNHPLTFCDFEAVLACSCQKILSQVSWNFPLYL